MDITLEDETKQLKPEQMELVEDIIQFAGKSLEIEDNTEISMIFVDNEEIHRINREYRHKDMPTDVISFALEENVEEDMPIVFADGQMPFPRNLGDVFISVDRAAEQAKEYHHSFEREIGFLAIHGFLHLNGYDHMEPEEEKEMFDLQRKILDEYGLKREE